MSNIIYSIDQQRYFGYNIKNSPVVDKFFNKDTIEYISKKITSLTKDVDEYGREIVLPDQRIIDLMNTVYQSYRPPQGFDQSWNQQLYFDSLVGQTISRAVFDIKNVLGYEQAFAKYTVWNTVLGENNTEGLRSHAPIKLKEKRPNTMEFNMKY